MPARTLVATALAMAERTGASGQDVLAAIVLGYEAAGRIGEAITPGFRTRGFHGCLVAIFGGAVATGRLLGLDAAAMAQAIALSATSIGGLMAAANTSVAREYHAGLAAMLGMHAALAAQRGYMAEERILETHQGFFEVYGGTDGASVTRDLGQEWDIITDMAIKLVPGGHPSHALAEAAANAARAGNIAPDDVETITLSRPGVTALSGPVHPTDLIGMAHSPAYFLAAGVADKDFSWVARDRGKDHGSSHPSAPRQGPRRRAAHAQRRAVQAGRDGDHSDEGRQNLLEHCLRTERVRQCAASPGPMSTPSTARWCRGRRCVTSRSKRACRSSTASATSRMSPH